MKVKGRYSSLSGSMHRPLDLYRVAAVCGLFLALTVNSSSLWAQRRTGGGPSNIPRTTQDIGAHMEFRPPRRRRLLRGHRRITRKKNRRLNSGVRLCLCKFRNRDG